MYGTDADRWVGKQIMLFSTPVPFQDRMVQAIRIRAPQAQQMPQATQQGASQYAQASGSEYNELNPPPHEG